jgi:integrase
MRIIGIQEFLSGYSIHNTRQNYYYSLLSYFCGVYPELQSLRDSKDPALETKLESFNLTYFTSNRNYQYDLVKFRDVLLVTKAPKTLEVRLAAVLCYMEENSVTFSKGFLRRLIPKGSSQAISDELIPSGEQLAKLCEYCSLLTKTVVLFMSSSGCRLGETLLIRLEELDLNHNPVRINLRAETTKTKHKRIVFISSEAKGVLQEWLTYREAWMVTASKQGHYKHPDDRRVFPIQQSSFLSIWATAVNRAGLGKRDQRTKRFLLHPHNLRKYVNISLDTPVAVYTLGLIKPQRSLRRSI